MASPAKSTTPQPAALTRVKGSLAMDTPSRSSAGTVDCCLHSDPRHINIDLAAAMSWSNEPSSMHSSPRTVQTYRSSTSTAVSGATNGMLTGSDHLGTPEPNSTTSLVNPTSSLLQDLLKEQRATRGSRGTTSEHSEDCVVPQTPQPSRSRSQSQSKSQSHTQSQDDAGSERQRKAQMALAAGLKHSREMGVREMDQVSGRVHRFRCSQLTTISMSPKSTSRIST